MSGKDRGMSDGYVATTEEVRSAYIAARRRGWRGIPTQQQIDEWNIPFDRWLADRDREVREQMLAEFQENEIRALAQLEATVGITLADTEDAQNAARIAERNEK